MFLPNLTTDAKNKMCRKQFFTSHYAFGSILIGYFGRLLTCLLVGDGGGMV